MLGGQQEHGWRAQSVCVDVALAQRHGAVRGVLAAAEEVGKHRRAVAHQAQHTAVEGACAGRREGHHDVRVQLGGHAALGHGKVEDAPLSGVECEEGSGLAVVAQRHDAGAAGADVDVAEIEGEGVAAAAPLPHAGRQESGAERQRLSDIAITRLPALGAGASGGVFALQRHCRPHSTPRDGELGCVAARRAELKALQREHAMHGRRVLHGEGGAAACRQRRRFRVHLDLCRRLALQGHEGDGGGDGADVGQHDGGGVRLAAIPDQRIAVVHHLCGQLDELEAAGGGEGHMVRAAGAVGRDVAHCRALQDGSRAGQHTSLHLHGAVRLQHRPSRGHCEGRWHLPGDGGWHFPHVAQGEGRHRRLVHGHRAEGDVFRRLHCQARQGGGDGHGEGALLSGEGDTVGVGGQAHGPEAHLQLHGHAGRQHECVWELHEEDLSLRQLVPHLLHAHGDILHRQLARVLATRAPGAPPPVNATATVNAEGCRSLGTTHRSNSRHGWPWPRCVAVSGAAAGGRDEMLLMRDVNSAFSCSATTPQLGGGRCRRWPGCAWFKA